MKNVGINQLAAKKANRAKLMEETMRKKRK